MRQSNCTQFVSAPRVPQRPPPGCHHQFEDAGYSRSEKNVRSVASVTCKIFGTERTKFWASLELNGQVWRECCCPDTDRNINCRPGIECAIVVIGYKLLFTSFPVFFCFVFIVKFMFEHRKNIVCTCRSRFSSNVMNSVTRNNAS